MPIAKSVTDFTNGSNAQQDDDHQLEILQFMGPINTSQWCTQSGHANCIHTYIYPSSKFPSYLVMEFNKYIGPSVENNPKLRSIELTKLLENYARNTQMETKLVELHKMLFILIYTIHH